MPRPSAPLANSNSRSGVRWAETIFVSCRTPNSSSVCDVISIVDQSLLLPIIMETSGFPAMLFLRELPLDDRFEFVPGLDRAAPVNDLALFADDNVLRESVKDEHFHRRLRIGGLFVI